ncbi:GNAT family N-acetyltransferase [Streptomyces sp. N35]|uniref:GNAT family N-acetyltransferase n=1 Tax=Streptomyces sp. N35 TaxID=2795730 RepID=UPI0027DD4D4E|nr:GNAT family N-acetyltransferase [Streptomyces sp. N35]
MRAVRLEVAATAAASALVLRPWRDDDIGPLTEAYRDPAMRQWLRSQVASTADAARWLEVRHRGWESGDYLSFAVQEACAGGALLGNVALKRSAATRQSAEVGYWTTTSARGRGVASRALEALTVWAFTAFEADGLVRLDLLHQVGNTASCKVAERTGYDFDRIVPARPPWPTDGHLHVRRAAGHSSPDKQPHGSMPAPRRTETGDVRLSGHLAEGHGSRAGSEASK